MSSVWKRDATASRRTPQRPPGQAPPGGAGNHRNGSTAKTVETALGPVTVRTPRDRDGSFAPKLVGKCQNRLAGLDEEILALYAGGMTVCDIAAHPRDLYGLEVGCDTISRVTEAVLEEVEAWRTRPGTRSIRSSPSTRCA